MNTDRWCPCRYVVPMQTGGVVYLSDYTPRMTHIGSSPIGWHDSVARMWVDLYATGWYVGDDGGVTYVTYTVGQQARCRGEWHPCTCLGARLCVGHRRQVEGVLESPTTAKPTPSSLLTEFGQ